MSGKKDSNNPGLWPIKGQKFGLRSRTGAWNQFLSLTILLIRLHHITTRWLYIQCFIFVFMFCIETPKVGIGPTNFWMEPYLASLSAISFTHTPACPGTQYTTIMCRVEISFNSLWHYCTNGDAVLTAWKAFRASCKIRKLVQNTRAHYCHCSNQMGVMVHTSTHYNTLMFARRSNIYCWTWKYCHMYLIICKTTVTASNGRQGCQQS